MREAFRIYRIFASRHLLRAWTPTAEFSMLQNCIAVHSTFRSIFSCRSKAVEAMHERIGERFLSRAFRETISAGRNFVFRNKKNLVTVILLAAYSTLEFLSFATQRNFAS